MKRDIHPGYGHRPPGGAGRPGGEVHPALRDPGRPSVTGVTVVACGVADCPHAAAGPAGCDEELRAAIRATPHGVLVRSGCLRGCTTTTAASAGACLLVQPCDTHRRPVGPALVVGPLHEPADVTECCAWIRAGAPEPAPAHLVAGVLAGEQSP